MQTFNNEQNEQTDSAETVVRLKDIERLLRTVFKDNFISVRKAFLSLDSDHDGLVSIEDFYRAFN